MATIIKLLIAALLINAVAQAGLAAFKYYKFEDTVHEALLFSASATDAELSARIAEIAADQDVPVDATDITVKREKYGLSVEMSYDEGIALIPGVYTKVWTFTPSASAESLAAIPLPVKK
jgi:hypothetical protein